MFHLLIRIIHEIFCFFSSLQNGFLFENQKIVKESVKMTIYLDQKSQNISGKKPIPKKQSRICETRFVKLSDEQIIGRTILQRYDGIKLNGFNFRPTTFNPGSFTESGYSVSVSAFTDGGRFQTTCYETKHGMLITIMYLGTSINDVRILGR